MTGVDHGGIFDSCIGQAPPRFHYSGFLDIEGPDMSCCADESRQEKRIMTIASSSVDHRITRAHTVFHEQMRPAHGGGQAAAGAGEAWREK
jgi:hypothetical protein